MNKTDNSTNSISNIWLKAAIAGGLWASVEIIVGSLLHNLKIPFAGSTLASFGIILMIAFAQIWPERGLIIRAGLICALMKSVSPSAVILGPMTGIMAEAILIEAGIYLFGRNLAGYLIGGAVALFSALIHKLLSLLILYGFNIIQIYINIIQFASRQINIPDADPVILLIYLSLIYLFIGAVAALTGFLIGRKAGKTMSIEHKFETSLESDKNFFQINPNLSFKTGFLFIHLLFIPGGLVLMNSTKVYIHLTIIFIYLFFCITYYKGIIRRLKKPFFWIQLMIIILLSFLFWNTFSENEGENPFEGLWIGAGMAMRAVFIVVAFSSLSVELRNPKIKEAIFRTGFSQLYLALNLSFAALPAMISNLSNSHKGLRNPFLFFPKLLHQAEIWHKTLNNLPREEKN
jgi:hypothetical protein